MGLFLAPVLLVAGYGVRKWDRLGHAYFVNGTETVAYACSAFLTYGSNRLTGFSSYCLLCTAGRNDYNTYIIRV